MLQCPNIGNLPKATITLVSNPIFAYYLVVFQLETRLRLTMEFWNQLPSLLKVFWGIALPISLLFIIQTVLTFFGADATDGTDADFDGNLVDGEGPLQLFSLRNLIHFLLGFSWGGLSLFSSISSPFLLIFVSIAIGILFVLVFFIVARKVAQLAQDNTFKIQSCIGMTASVYLTIPGQMSGTGKVNLSVKGSYKELDAMTSQDSIPTGNVVVITQVNGESIVIVQKMLS